MNFIKEQLRDKSRDNLYENLLNIGLDCSLSERGSVEEKLFNPWHRRSLGIIKINSDPHIKYINIIKRDGSKNSPPRWWNYFAVPTLTSNSKEDYIEVNSIRKKSFPILGKVKSIDWESNHNGQVLSDTFTKDSEINSLAIKLGDIKVQSLHENFSGYSIELEFKTTPFMKRSFRKSDNNPIDINQWNALAEIANLCVGN